MKFILGALVAVSLLVGVAASQPAEARCVWNGYGWQCWHSHYHRAYGWHGAYGGWHRHHYWRGY